MKSSQSHSKFFVLAIRIGIAVLLCGLFTGVVLASWPPSDVTIDDFYQGNGCYVSQADTGQVAGAVIIPPTAGTIFSGTVLESGWSFEPTSSGAVANGNATVNLGRVGTTILHAPSRSLEFVATFENTNAQHAGFAIDLTDVPYAIFSTGTGGGYLYARSNGIANQVGNQYDYAGSPHLYRIDWEADRVIYSIDGNPVITHSITITNDMRPLAADGDGNPDTAMTVNWTRMSAYAPSPCTYTSRIINSFADDTHWTNFTTQTVLPAGTSISFDVRAATSEGGVNSASWVPVTSNTIDVTGRYVQYRATLETNDPLVTPQLLEVSFEGTPLAITLTSISATPTTSPGAGWLMAGLSGAGLLLALYGYQQIRRRSQP